MGQIMLFGSKKGGKKKPVKAKKTTTRKKAATPKKAAKKTTKKKVETAAQKARRLNKRPQKQTGVSKVAIDKAVKAMPPGYRVSSSGRIYKENRKNRSDAKGKRV